MQGRSYPGSFQADARYVGTVHNDAVLQTDESSRVNLDYLRDSFQLNVTAALALNQFLLAHMKPIFVNHLHRFDA